MEQPDLPYIASEQPVRKSSDELRALIPGWGADLDPKDRPSVPRERLGEDTGAHWAFPERQPEKWPRERSIEHGFLPPVFGTACPPTGVSGAMRKYAYRRFSEGRAAHWLLLIAADRVDAVESHVRSFATLRPDNPITETGIASEFSRHGISSRVGKGRTDVGHQLFDPVIVAGPWIAGAFAAYRVAKRLTRSAKSISSAA